MLIPHCAEAEPLFLRTYVDHPPSASGPPNPFCRAHVPLGGASTFVQLSSLAEALLVGVGSWWRHGPLRWSLVYVGRRTVLPSVPAQLSRPSLLVPAVCTSSFFIVNSRDEKGDQTCGYAALIQRHRRKFPPRQALQVHAYMHTESSVQDF